MPTPRQLQLMRNDLCDATALRIICDEARQREAVPRRARAGPRARSYAATRRSYLFTNDFAARE